MRTNRPAQASPVRLALVVVAAAALALSAAACAEEEDVAVEESDADRVATIVALDADPAAGGELYVEGTQPTCASCHALAAAGVEEGTASDLDELQPDAATTIASLATDEIGAHAAQDYHEVLTDQEIADVSAYVEAEAGS